MEIDVEIVSIVSLALNNIEVFNITFILTFYVFHCVTLMNTDYDVKIYIRKNFFCLFLILFHSFKQ
jgi:hypothetical protein